MWPLTGVGTKVEVPQGGGGGCGDKEREARGNKTILSEMNTKTKTKEHACSPNTDSKIW